MSRFYIGSFEPNEEDFACGVIYCDLEASEDTDSVLLIPEAPEYPSMAPSSYVADPIVKEDESFALRLAVVTDPEDVDGFSCLVYNFAENPANDTWLLV